MQFLDDGLDAHALDAHARADRVHARLGGRDGHLGALAGFAGDGADLDNAVIDLRDFVLEQAAQEIAMRAREDDLRAACRCP